MDEIDSHHLPENFKLDNFRIIRVLGQGAFGVTYLAEDPSLLKKVAIKEYFPREFSLRTSSRYIRPVGAADDLESFNWGLRKFLDEARVLARLNHKNIVRVMRFFESFGTAYLVMEYCEGKSLDQVIKERGPLSPTEVVPILEQLATGLAHVHEFDYLHRDIKPANIFVKSNSEVVLIDFGAAKEGFSSHSKSATSLASAGYAPFEQYSTRGAQGPWSDLYGLSSTMYKLLTGEKPQDSPDRILQDELIPLTKRLGGKHPQHISLFMALDRSLSIRPEDRPQSVSQFLSEAFPKSANSIATALPDLLNSQGIDKVESVGGRKKIALIGVFVSVAASLSLVVFIVSDDGNVSVLQPSTMTTSASDEKPNPLTQDLIPPKDPSSRQPKGNLESSTRSIDPQTDSQSLTKKPILDRPKEKKEEKPVMPAAKDVADPNRLAINPPRQQANSDLPKELATATPTTTINIEQIKTLIIASQDCFLLMKYDCAIRNADAVLAIEPGNKVAREIKEKSNLASRR